MGFLVSIGEQLLSLMLPVLATFGTAAVGHLVTWLRSKTNGTKVSTAMDVLYDLVTTVVSEMEQTVVGALRDGNGKLDKATADRVKQQCLDRIKQLFGPAGLVQLAARLGIDQGQLTQLISAKIEQAVFQLKSTPPATTTTAPAGPLTPFDPNRFGGMTPDEINAAHGIPSPSTPG